MELESLTELYLEQLRTLYDAEHQLRDVLPRMIEAATSRELRDSLEHLQERNHVAGARKHLEQHGDENPRRRHMRHRGRDALEPWDGEQQPDNQCPRQDERDESVAQAPTRRGSIHLHELRRPARAHVRDLRSE